MLFVILAAFALTLPDGSSRPQLTKLPDKEKLPGFREALPRPNPTPPPAKRKFFGLGIGFTTRGTAQGISLEQVVPRSPAERAGLASGTVIAEINGESTLGRSGEECTRMVRDSANAVTLKYYDPATLKLRSRTVDKDWFDLPD